MKEENNRFTELSAECYDYNQIYDSIESGIDNAEKSASNKAKIMKYLGGNESDWNDYRWQLKHRFTDIEEASNIIGISHELIKGAKSVSSIYRVGISPYYLSLIDPGNSICPIMLQSFPSENELDSSGVTDPMDEEGWTPCELVTRRYPDRLIIKVTNQCGMFCRFCQRRRLIGESDHHSAISGIMNAIQYVRENPEIRDVLLTGGDALMLSDNMLDKILAEIRSITHVEIIRIGTRTPVTLPQRITPKLVSMIKKYHPVYLNTHFNHPAEITPESMKACAQIANAGIPIGNQMVLLNHINNDKYTVMKLNQLLLKSRVKPYYIFHPKTVRGTSHFWVSIEEGLEIMEFLRGRTSGMAIPTYIINGPGGLGKTPIMPNYLLYIGSDHANFRSWRGQMFTVPNNPGHS